MTLVAAFKWVSREAAVGIRKASGGGGRTVRSDTTIFVEETCAAAPRRCRLAEAGHAGRIEVDEGLDELANQRLAARAARQHRGPEQDACLVAGVAAHADIELLDELMSVRPGGVEESRRSGVEAIGSGTGPSRPSSRACRLHSSPSTYNP